MNVTIRADASLRIGFGHVMRCLTLADALRDCGTNVQFISRILPGHLGNLLEEKGFPVLWLPSPDEDGSEIPDHTAHSAWLGVSWQVDAEQTWKLIAGLSCIDWLIVDSYALDREWESRMRPYVNRIMVIDDLADRPHDCDLLLDQNLVADMAYRYNSRVPDHCGLMLGTKYALLQPLYAKLHDRIPPREGPIHRILVYFGGADSRNLTGLVISAFNSINHRDIVLDVVVNLESAFSDDIYRQIEGQSNITLHGNLPNLAQLMVQADISIGACGSTSWERCCLGLPSIVITLAENQKSIASELHRQGLIHWIGHYNEVNKDILAQVLKGTIEYGLRQDWSVNCQRLLDGRGTERVRAFLLLGPKTLLHARLAKLDDESIILGWANDKLVRQNAFISRMIDPITHRIWFRRCLRNLDGCYLYIIETSDGFPIGQVRFEKSGQAWEIDYSLDACARGRGTGKILLQTAMMAFKTTHQGALLLARVKKSNIASLRTFDALDFVSENKSGGIIYRYLL